MQKLVTIWLTGWQLKHGTVEEHLTDELAEGWRITSATIAGGSATNASATAWAVVVLERPANGKEAE